MLFNISGYVHQIVLDLNSRFKFLFDGIFVLHQISAFAKKKLWNKNFCLVVFFLFESIRTDNYFNAYFNRPIIEYVTSVTQFVSDILTNKF